MKYVLFCMFIACFAGPSLRAQDSVSSSKWWRPTAAGILRNQSSEARKTTSIQQRVIGYSKYLSGNSSQQPDDSMYFRYSGDRGSRFNFSGMYYDFGNYATGVSADTSIHTAPSSNAAIKQFVHYTTAGLADTVIAIETLGSNTITFTRNSYTYNASGRVQINYEDKWDAATQSWKPATQTVPYYSSSNQFLYDTTYNVSNGQHIAAATFYCRYDATGKVDSAIHNTWYSGYWVPVFVEGYTYYPGSLVKTYYSWSQTYNTRERDSFGYTNNAPNYTFRDNKTEHYAGTTTWILNHQQTLRSLNAAGLPDSTFKTDTSGTYFATKTIYNSYNNPVTTFTYLTGPSQTTTTLQATERYYYELYGSGVSVQEVQPVTEVAIYPNPVSAALNIKTDNALTGVTLSVFNALGQRIATQKLNGDNITTLQVTALTPGVYWLTLSRADGTVAARESFVKN